jgi:AcrR family transcriptional regulator
MALAMGTKTKRAPARGTAAAPEGHPDRGARAREQLLAHATRIFAAKGYATASTREICEAAGANVAAIHYYFGDKEGIYRAVLTRPISAVAGRFADSALPFAQAIRQVLLPFVAMALDEDTDARNVMRLHLREALEPTPVFRDVVARAIVPQHHALAGLLARHCGLKRSDAGIHQLAFALIAMANDYCMSHEYIRLLAPQLLDRAGAAERIVDRLVGYSVALLEHEIADRRARARSGSADARARRGGRARSGTTMP